MLRQPLDSLLTRLKAYFDLERLGRLIGELLVDVIIAAIVLVIFYVARRGSRPRPFWARWVWPA